MKGAHSDFAHTHTHTHRAVKCSPSLQAIYLHPMGSAQKRNLEEAGVCGSAGSVAAAHERPPAAAAAPSCSGDVMLLFLTTCSWCPVPF